MDEIYLKGSERDNGVIESTILSFDKRCEKRKRGKGKRKKDGVCERDLDALGEERVSKFLDMTEVCQLSIAFVICTI
jgi:hypothetical protein